MSVCLGVSAVFVSVCLCRGVKTGTVYLQRFHCSCFLFLGSVCKDLNYLLDLCLLIPSGTKGRNNTPPANSILASPP